MKTHHFRAPFGFSMQSSLPGRAKRTGIRTERNNHNMVLWKSQMKVAG